MFVPLFNPVTRYRWLYRRERQIHASNVGLWGMLIAKNLLYKRYTEFYQMYMRFRDSTSLFERKLANDAYLQAMAMLSLAWREGAHLQ